MKKTLLIVFILGLLSSCSSYTYNSDHQAKVIHNFGKKKHGVFIPTRKIGSLNHPAVTKSSRKNQIQKIKSQRTSIN